MNQAVRPGLNAYLRSSRGQLWGTQITPVDSKVVTNGPAGPLVTIRPLRAAFFRTKVSNLTSNMAFRFHRSLRRRRLSIEQFEGRRVLAAVDIPDTLTGAPAATVSAPVNIDSATGVRAAEIRLSYDTAKLDLTQSAVTLGTVWSGATDAQITANVDDTAGTVVIFISSSSALTSTSGSLVQLGFTVASGATVGSTAALNLTGVRLNEGALTVSPAPAAGADSTDGLITIGSSTGTDRIAGFVFADTNSSNAIDSLEGIAGVTITLTSSTGTTKTATTGADGSYEFTGLAAGTYTIAETQPVAYLDGGSNSLSVTLVSGTALTGQNFRELGLLPKFLYNRLLTTSVLPVGSANWTTEIAKINADATSGKPSTAPILSSPTTSTSASSTPTQAAAMSSMSEILVGSDLDEGNQSSAESVANAVTVAASYVAPPQADDEDASNTENVDAALEQSQVW